MFKRQALNSSGRAFAGSALLRGAVSLVFALTSSTWAAPNDGMSQTRQPFKIVIPFGAGGVADLTARVVGQALSERLGQAVIIENKPGAGGIIASDLVAKSEPDGHTLLLISNATAVSASLFKNLPYDTLKDFAPVSLLGTFDIAVIVPESSKFNSLGELIAYAKSNPGKLNMGSINVGSTQNLAAELLKSTAAIDVQVVPFNGTPALISALRGGQIDVATEILTPVLPQINAHVLKVLAVTGEKRSASMPEVPTALESQVKGMVAASWNGVAVPAKTPEATIEHLNKEIVEILRNPTVRQKLLNLNVEPKPTTPQQAQEWLRAEIKVWGQVINRAGIEKQ